MHYININIGFFSCNSLQSLNIVRATFKEPKGGTMKVFAKTFAFALTASVLCFSQITHAKAVIRADDGDNSSISDPTIEGGRRKPVPVNPNPGNGGGYQDVRNLDICFSPAGNCDQKLISFISSATRTLDIAIYSITHDGIVQAIQDAKSRGVQVRMVVDRSQSNGTHSLVSTLKSAGIPLKIGNVRGIMHNKFTIRDGNMIETGSYNYTSNATNDNAENQIYLDDSNVVSQYVQQFEALYQNGLE